MATGAQVLSSLIPVGGWSIHGDDFDSIIYDEGVTPLTKKEFDDGFALADSQKKAEISAKEKTRKSALSKLEALGLTEDEVNGLIS
jgi:hypothetical protein